MTLANSDNQIAYAANGIETDFVVPYKFYDEDHLMVTAQLGPVAAELLTIGEDYTVTINEDYTGTVTFTTAPDLGTIIVIRRWVPLEQQTFNPDNAGGLDVESYEQAIDICTMQIQQLAQRSAGGTGFYNTTGGYYLGLSPSVLNVWDAKSFRVINSKDPVGTYDLATKNYVDSMVSGSLVDLTGTFDWDVTLQITGHPVKIWNETYGVRDTAVGLSVIVNQPDDTNAYRGTAEGITEVMGGYDRTPNDINSYASRDSVGFFTSNTAPPVMATGGGTVTYTANSVTASTWTGYGPVAVDLTTIPVGTLIDTLHTPKFTGRLLSVNTTLKTITVDAWYEDGAANGTTGTPADGTGCVVNPVTKIWGQNTLIGVPAKAYATAAAGHEIGVYSNKQEWPTDANGLTTWAMDVVNLGQDWSDGSMLSGFYPLTVAYIQRGSFLHGFQSNGASQNGFLVWSDGAVVGAPDHAFNDASDSDTSFYTVGTHTNVLWAGSDASTRYFSIDGDGDINSRDITLRNGAGDPTIGFTDDPADPATATIVYSIAGDVFLVSKSIYLGGNTMEAEHIELRKVANDPYIDFSRDASDFHVRMQATADDTITVTKSGGGAGIISTGLVIANQAAGAPTLTQDGEVGIDETNKRLYIRIAGVNRYTILT